MTKRDNRIVTAGEMDLGESVCDKVAGTGTDAGGLTQRGSGYDDDIFYHDSEEQTVSNSTENSRSSWLTRTLCRLPGRQFAPTPM